MTNDFSGWGLLLDRWHDEGRTGHLLKGDGSPACGVRYFASTGPYPIEVQNKCRRCLRIERSRAAKKDDLSERLREEMNEREWAWTAGARGRGTL